MSWQQLRQRAADLQQRRSGLAGRLRHTELMQKTTLATAQGAQMRLNAADSVRDVLDRLQRREHERAVGAYEDLLSAFLADVLPGDRRIVMDLHAERGAPALDVFIRKGDNSPLEDAWLGTGGSITNLLSTGLRLIALLRSGQRRFLVLDESDCWIKPDLIPRYAAVVAQMAQDLDVQILMISHHDESLFAQSISHRLRLEQLKSGLLSTEWSATSDIPVWAEDQTGIRSILLNDFQSHERTFIPLSPGVTLLQGDNDIGKSAVVNALRAVFDGDSNDTLIRHHASSAQVWIDAGPDHMLVWQRYRKGKVKVAYRLVKSDDQSTIHAAEGTKVPEWVRTHMRVGQVDGLDIQIGQQQNPVFLLDEPASQRAKALAIGQESGHVNTMMLLDRTQVQEAKSTLKNAEHALEGMRHALQTLAPLAQTGPDWMGIMGTTDQRVQDLARGGALLRTWRRTQGTHGALAGLKTAAMPNTVPVARAGLPNSLLMRWAAASNGVDILAPLDPAPIIVPPVRSSVAPDHLCQRWTRADTRSAVLARVAQGLAPRPPQTNTDPTLLAMAGKWTRDEQLINAAAADVATLIDDEHQLNHLLAQRFPVCPSCQQAWDHDAH